MLLKGSLLTGTGIPHGRVASPRRMAQKRISKRFSMETNKPKPTPSRLMLIKLISEERSKMLVMATKIILLTFLLAILLSWGEADADHCRERGNNCGAVVAGRRRYGPAKNKEDEERRNRLMQVGVTSPEAKRDRSCMRDSSSCCSGRSLIIQELTSSHSRRSGRSKPH